MKNRSNTPFGPDLNSILIYVSIGLIAVLVMVLFFLFVLAPMVKELPGVTSSEAVSSDTMENYSSDSPLHEDSLSEQDAVNATSFDGKWNRNRVRRELQATITITDQTAEGFKFNVNASNGSESCNFTQTANFVSSNRAEYRGANNSIISFTLKNSVLTVTHAGNLDDLGGKQNVGFAGEYILGAPKYAVTDDDNPYYADLRKSSVIVNALSNTLTKADFDLYNFIFTEGQVRVYQDSESAFDRDGKQINVDAELAAIKYYAVYPGSGSDVILICSNDGKVYVGIREASEMRYYSNDNNYKAKAPKSIEKAAKNNSATLVYMN